jgi:hypothetical protein
MKQHRPGPPPGPSAICEIAINVLANLTLYFPDNHVPFLIAVRHSCISAGHSRSLMTKSVKEG